MTRIFRFTPALALLVGTACATARPTADTPAAPTSLGAGGTISNSAERLMSTTPSADTEGGVSEMIPVPADQVYAVLHEAYTALGIEALTVNPRDRTLGNTSFFATRRIGRRLVTDYVRCAEDPLGSSMARTRPVHMSVLTTITPVSGGSRLTTRVQGSTSTSERAGAFPCQSTGALEAAISVAVKQGLLRS